VDASAGVYGGSRAGVHYVQIVRGGRREGWVHVGAHCEQTVIGSGGGVYGGSRAGVHYVQTVRGGRREGEVHVGAHCEQGLDRCIVWLVIRLCHRLSGPPLYRFQGFFKKPGMI
jgi:hypothetical protein